MAFPGLRALDRYLRYRYTGQYEPGLYESTSIVHSFKTSLLGLSTVMLAVPVALSIEIVHEWLPEPEQAVLLLLLSLVAAVSLGITLDLTISRGKAPVERVGLIALTTIVVVLVAIYFYWVSPFVFFPADILIWSESDFVNDILKFRVGYPIFSSEKENESFIYMPGAQLLTYFIAWLAGFPESIAGYRVVQLVYAILAAVTAWLCWRLVVHVGLASSWRHEKLWAGFLVPAFFLIATNSLTNPFSHNLHNDALAQLVTVIAYYLLLTYSVTGDRRLIIAMGLIPSVGFLVKQSLLVWLCLYLFHLVLFDRFRSWARVIAFLAISLSSFSMTVLACYAIWGYPFLYWAFVVLGSHGGSILRSVQHGLEVWIYPAIGLIAGLVLLRKPEFRVLAGAWFVWLILIISEVCTSGIGWMLNHIGPGSLIAGVWFMAALAFLWPFSFNGAAQGKIWLHNATAVLLICLMFSGLGVIRIPARTLPKDAFRYVSGIEREFAGDRAQNILLDLGTWVYFKHGVVMKDRAPSIGDRGYSGTGDFSGLIERLQEKVYSKILVRNLHSSDFWYDHELWRHSSGIRTALLKNYSEVYEIAAVQDDRRYGFRTLSVLVPRNGAGRPPKPELAK